MELSNEIYKQLEAVVGKRNISRAKSTRECYRCITAQSSDHRGPYAGKTPLPMAVILPGNTEEVQKVVQICNEHKIDFKASSTFWSAMGYIGSDYGVQIDMRRMKNITIDKDNMLAIIEPYAITSALQAEAMKYGLNYSISGAGSTISALASTTGWIGHGPSTISMGSSTENMLGGEWVLANGDILRTGSLGAGAGWFCGEGPGPSVRGLMKGKFGPAGSLGICTRLAVRLHPWYDDKPLETYGTAPAYRADVPKKRFSAYGIGFPSWQSYADCLFEFYNSDIVYISHKQFSMFGKDLKAAMIKILNDPDLQMADLERLTQDPEIKKANDALARDVYIVLASATEREHEYKEKVLDEILKRNGAWKSEYMSEEGINEWLMLYLVRMGHKNLNYVMCGAYEGNVGISNNVYHAIKFVDEFAALKAKWENETPYIARTGGDSSMGASAWIGGGQGPGWEFFTNFDAYDKESIKGTAAFFDATQELMNKHHLGVDMGKGNVTCRNEKGYNFTQEEQDEMAKGLPQPEIAYYQYRVRQILNPNNLTGSYYKSLSKLDD